ncbi:dihydroorotate dehydrogenase electron transfer subunit [Natranaerobius trueperi]|uniref:Dihydroorotate dehydrogenase B (NAD(+)), electron transfer subunit n=1 Tax=Natranaerobius trueperi TaxID=759412 RepID=A0A226BYH9_9FIRM|nr:dihydroorotate dehydrogenase electron transfer subunit [Natranaerobius trueperi]OWZ83190.1 dihydroorotate dehydrogenase electron transfer subunit [Natranaerobius trueperi]
MSTIKQKWVSEKTVVVSNKPITKDCYQLVLKSPKISSLGEPGQFINILMAQEEMGFSTDPLLPRPLSIYDLDKEQGYASVVYRVVGKGTKLLSQLRSTDKLKIMGPLGKGFKYRWDEQKNLLLVAGGIGVFPLFLLAQSLQNQGHHVKLLAGLKNKEELPLIKPFIDLGITTEISTDDGSYNYQGTVIDLLKLDLLDNQYDFCYTCGREEMMKTVNNLMVPRDISVQVSLEKTMACGVGACLGCTCKTNLKQVCTDGPVFSGNEVFINE